VVSANTKCLATALLVRSLFIRMASSSVVLAQLLIPSASLISALAAAAPGAGLALVSLPKVLALTAPRLLRAVVCAQVSSAQSAVLLLGS